MKKTLQTANGIALIITIVINYLSNTGLFNGNTMATVSARYQNLFTPAGYAFSIWGLIYLGLLSFVFYQGRGLFRGKGSGVGAHGKRVGALEDTGRLQRGDAVMHRGDRSVAQTGAGSGQEGVAVQAGRTEVLDQDLALKVGWWFVVSCVANSCWVLAWLYDYTGLSVLIMLVLLFSLLKIILRTDMEMTDPPLKTIAFVWWPFCLYSGWISVALIADIAAWLTKIKWNAFSIPGSSWAIIMICVAGGIHLFMTWKRNMREFALAGAWALVAVAMANRGREASVAEAGFILAAVLVISSGIHGYRNRKFSPWRKRVLPIVFLLLAGMAGRSQEKGLSLSGKVEDPYSHKGIPGVYVSFLGMHATGIMGGTEYLDDLLLDSTDAEGRFRLRR